MGAFQPSDDETHDLGTTLSRWKDVHADKLVITGSLNNGTPLTSTIGGTLSVSTLTITDQSSSIALNNNKITGLAAPESNSDAATKAYVDTAIGNNSEDVTLAGVYDYLTLSNQQITLNQIDYDTDISNLPTIPNTPAIYDNSGTPALTTGITIAEIKELLDLESGSDIQAYDAGLADIANLDVDNGNFIVGDGANWVAKSANDARTSLGLGTENSPQFASLTLSGQSGSLSMNSQNITNLATPTADTDAATKAYVDGVAQGLSAKDSVRAATTGSFTMASAASTSTLILANGEGGFDADANTLTTDGVSLSEGDRVLIKDGVNSNGAGVDNKWNGVYTVGSLTGDSLTLTRAADFDAAAEIQKGAFVFVEEGTTNDNAGFVLTTSGSITVGTTGLEFVQFSGAGQITAGNGLTKSGNTLSADLKLNGGLVIEGGEIAVKLDASSITGTLAVGDGGTGLSTISTGQVLYASGNNTIAAAAPGQTSGVQEWDAQLDTLATMSANTSSALAALTSTEVEILDDATVSTAELNILNGDTSAIATTIVDADRVVLNDAGIMKQVAVTDIATYVSSNISITANNLTDEDVYLTFVDEATGKKGLETDSALTYNPSSNTLTATTFSGTATNVNVATNFTTDETVYLTFVEGAGSQGVEYDNSLSYNPSTNTITANTLTANLSGTATNVNVTANFTTDGTEYLAFVGGAGSQGVEYDNSLTYNPSTNMLTANKLTTSEITLGATTLTATGEELNYVNGVTSSIQTQLDNLSGTDISVTLTGAVTGTGTITNLSDVSIVTTAASDPTLTINGDASGTATFTNLGDATLELTIANDSVTNDMLSNITRGSIKIGGASNAPTDLDASGAGKILVGDGVDIASVAVSGDASLASNGALTISNDAVTYAKIQNITTANRVLGSTTADGIVSEVQVTNDMLFKKGFNLSLNGVSQEDINLGDTLDFNGTASQVNIAYSTAANDLTFSLPATINVNTSGNAATSSLASEATILATARNIGGVSFNGSADINLPGVNTAGNQNTSGNAATASSWETGRTISLTGDVTGTSEAFDGSGNLSFATTIADNSVTLGTHTEGNYVATIAGTANEITVSGSGSENAAVTISLPDDVTIGNDLTVTGDLTVNGTTTTVNSTTVTIDDPIFTLGGDTAPSSDDSKDRGIEFRYYDSQARIGFIGWDNDADKFVLLKNATNTNEVFSGTAADLTIGALATTGITLDGNLITASADELNYTDGVTSNIQTQLDAKQATLTGAATTISGDNLTASRAIISNGAGKVVVSDVTSTELGYLDGVTSAIQAQLNTKQSTLTFGISDTNSLRVDSSTVASGEYARFTASGIESRSAADVRSDLNVDVAGTDNSTNVTLANTNYLSISGQEITGGTVPVTSGGTGATSASAARTALGLGSISTQAANDVNISGGTIAGLSDLEVTGGDVTKIKLYHSSTTNTSGPEIEFSRYDSSANGIEAGDNLGEIWFAGSEDDTNFYKAAAIIGEADGSWDPGNDHPGRLSFYTTSGSSTYTQVLKLDSSKNATFANNVSIGGTLEATGIATLASDSVIGNMTYSNNTITGADSNDIKIVSKDSVTIKLDSDNNNIDSSLFIVDNTDTIKAYIRETGAASFLSISASSGTISGTIAAQAFAGPANTNLLASSTDDIVFLVDSNNNEGKNYLYYYKNNISTTDNKFMEIADDGELTLYGSGIVNCKQLVSNSSGNFSINIAQQTSLDITEGVAETVVFSLDTLNDEISYKFDLIPSTNNTYDLGSSSNKVKDVYVDGIVYTDAVSSTSFSVDASGDITLDADGGEIYFKDNGVTGGTFYTNEGILKTEGRIVIKETEDIDLDGTSGGLVIGNELGSHLAFDQNEIMAKSTPTTATTLYLNNEGGKVSIGSTDPVASATALVVNGDSKTAGYYVCEMNNGASDLASYSNNILHLKYTNITTANLDSTENYVLFSGSDGFTGSIDANGGTVNYNAFTGQHISPISTSEVSEIENLGVGSIVISNGINLLDNSINETYVGSSLSRTAKDKKVYGVVSNLPWYPGNDGWAGWESDVPAVTVNSLGNGRILVTNISGNIENGDYICSSEIDGIGMLQDDDLLHNYTVAKCTEDIDWDAVNDFVMHNGVSYKKCLVGCTYHCG